jgi:polyhydroxybutyrate depolymerase
MNHGRLLILLPLLLFLLTGSAQTTVDGSFIYDGLLRSYRLYIPAVYDPSEPVPLVLNLHGYGSNNIEQEFYGDFRPLADTANFIIAHPNGTLDALNNRFWNTFGNSTVDDAGFLSALIDTVSLTYSIDANSIYCAGMSNGGFMSYELGCVLSNRIAAVASVTGSMIWSHLNSCFPQHPMPVMEIHGTADNVVPYGGSDFIVPIDTLVGRWVRFNGCSSDPEIILVPDIDPDDGCTAELYRYSSGEAGSMVELYKVLGGGHSWPGALVTIDVTNMDFSASEVIWQFFNQFTINGLVLSGNKQVPDINPVMIFPNPSSGRFALKFPDALEKRIRILNATGQVVQEFTCEGNQTEVVLQVNGIYILLIQQQNLFSSHKLIVQLTR